MAYYHVHGLIPDGISQSEGYKMFEQYIASGAPMDNFDGWESISLQQWIFSRALDVYKGKKISIKCDCCENVGSLQSDFDNIKKENCYGKKCAYMIEKVVDEIVLAKTRRESDGTYSA